MKNYYLFTINFIILFFVSLVYFIHNHYSADFFNIKILICLFTFNYFWVFFCSIKIFKINSLYIMFLFTITIFIFSRIFISFFYEVDFAVASKWRIGNFDKNEIKTILLYFSFSILAIHQGALCCKRDTLKKIVDLPFSPRLYKIGMVLFLLSILPFTYKLYIQLLHVLNNGYIESYVALGEINYPIWTKGSGTLVLVGFALILSSNPPLEKVKFVFFIFGLSQFIMLLQGSRGSFITTILFIYWYASNVYKMKVSLKTLIIMFLTLVALAQSVAFIRSGGQSSFSIIDNLFYFFWEQGTSIQVPFYAIRFEELLSNSAFSYLFFPFFGIAAIGKGQSYEFIQEFSSLPHQLTYLVNPTAYLSGEGLGGSFLAEIYLLPSFFILPLLFALGYMIVYFNESINKRWVLLFSCIFVPHVLWMSRGSFLIALVDIIPIIIVFFVSYFFKKKSI